MDIILSSSRWQSVILYIEDTVIFSETRQEHIAHTKKVFTALKEACVELRLKKWAFLRVTSTIRAMLSKSVDIKSVITELTLYGD